MAHASGVQLEIPYFSPRRKDLGSFERLNMVERL